MRSAGQISDTIRPSERNAFLRECRLPIAAQVILFALPEIN